MNQPIISLEAAHANNLVIATDKGIPWHLPADSLHWRSLIAGHVIIVGDTTYREQGTMEDSYNIVISRQADLIVPKGQVAGSVEQALEVAKAHESKEVFVVGGASVFAQTINQADRLYLTIIDLEVAGGTRTFPPYQADFHLISEQPGNDNGLSYRFTIWERR